MAAFYGTIQGNRGMATRCGTPNSGVKTSIQSWQGSCITELWYNEKNELMISIGTSNCSSCYSDKILYSGKFSDLQLIFQK